MINIEFNLNQRITLIQAKQDDPFSISINSFLKKSNLNTTSVYFLANSRQINPIESVKTYMNSVNEKDKKIQVLVNIIEDDNKDKENVIIKSNDIICPKCKEPCRIEFEDYKIILFDCINGHETKDISIKDFADTQKVNLSKIMCDKCKIKNKGNCPKNDFYKCLTCNQNLCLVCRPNHNSDHNVIRYIQKNYICQKHYEPLIKYCKQCKTNICFSCVEHKNHK